LATFDFWQKFTRFDFLATVQLSLRTLWQHLTFWQNLTFWQQLTFWQHLTICIPLPHNYSFLRMRKALILTFFMRQRVTFDFLATIDFLATYDILVTFDFLATFDLFGNI
jgi:hypothetical protein